MIADALDLIGVAWGYVYLALRAIAVFFGADRYAAQATCLENDPVMMILYVASNVANMVAYIAIGAALLVKRAQIIHLSPGVFLLFGVFLLLGSLEYLAQIVTVFVGVYRLDVLILALNGGVSCVTAAFTLNAVFGPGTQDHEEG